MEFIKKTFTYSENENLPIDKNRNPVSLFIYLHIYYKLVVMKKLYGNKFNLAHSGANTAR